MDREEPGGVRGRWSAGQVSLVRALAGLVVVLAAPFLDTSALPVELARLLVLLRAVLGVLLALGVATRSSVALLLAVSGWRLAFLSPVELALLLPLGLLLWPEPARAGVDPPWSRGLPAGFVPVARLLAFLGIAAVLWTGAASALPGLLPLLLLAADPGWLPARGAARPAVVYYDGGCGLCHRTVRLLVAEDGRGPGGPSLRFAPLGGPTFRGAVAPERRAGLPDSVLVATDDGRLLERSEGTVFLLVALGGLWRLAGHLLALCPRPLRDLAYDGVARLRSRLFRAPDGTCPFVPRELEARFLP